MSDDEFYLLMPEDKPTSGKESPIATGVALLLTGWFVANLGFMDQLIAWLAW